MKVRNKYPINIGQKFNRLTLIAKAEIKKNQRLWEFLCDCGKTVKYPIHKVYNNLCVSCGCYGNEIRKKKRGPSKLRLPENLALYRQLIIRYKGHAKRRKLEWNLSEEQAIVTFKSNCFYCLSEPSQLQTNRYKTYFVKYNGIDRIDSNKGYTTDNIVSCCGICNTMKLDHSFQDFKVQIERIYKTLFKA